MHFALLSFSSNKFLVVVINHNGLIRFWKRPRANSAIEVAAPTSGAFQIVTLLTKRLPVLKGIIATAKPRNSMIGRQFHGRLLVTTVRAAVRKLKFDRIPIRGGRLLARFSLLSKVQTLKLVMRAFFYDARESFFALQFSQSAKYVFVGRLAMMSSKSVQT